MVCAKFLSDAGCAQGFSGKEGEEMPLEQRIAEAEMLRAALLLYEMCTLDAVAICGEMWRKDGDNETITTLEPGCSLTIPLGTHFQFRNLLSEPLQLILVTMPPWPGNDEAISVPGRWPTED